MSRWWGLGGANDGFVGGCSDDPIQIDLKVAQVVVAPDARVLSVGDMVAVGNPSIAHVTGHFPGEVVISALSEGVRGEVRVRVRS